MKVCWKCFIVCLFFVSILGYAEFFIVSPSYNNNLYYKDNLESIFSQTNKAWKLCYIDDCSEDKTGELVTEYVQKRGMQDKCLVICNKVRQGAMANIYHAIHTYCSPEDIVVCLDGDDMFYDNTVLQTLADIYSDPSVWITHGSCKQLSTGKRKVNSFSYTKKIMRKRLFRKVFWYGDHIRSFYAKLFQKILKKDLMFEGKFFQMTYDMAIMFPMLEMASQGHIRYVKRFMLLYNDCTQINDHKVNLRLQQAMDEHIRSLPKYKPLKHL